MITKVKGLVTPILYILVRSIMHFYNKFNKSKGIKNCLYFKILIVLRSKILNMNCKIYFLIITSLVLGSCKTGTKSDVAPTKLEKTTPPPIKNDPVLEMVDKSNFTITATKAKIIDISSIEELVSKADHNTTLRLKKANYELPDNLVYYITADKKEIIDKNIVETRSVGGQVFISGMTNFSIIGNDSEIYSTNPKAVPLFILSGNQGEIKNLTIGHKTSGKDLPVVPSLYISNSTKINFSNCQLGKNSKAGLKINNSEFLTFKNCNISKSHSQIMEIYQGRSIQFVNSVFKNNECTYACLNFLGTENSLEFNNINVINNRSIGDKTNNYKHIITGPIQNISFKHSKFQGNKNFDKFGVSESILADCEVQTF